MSSAAPERPLRADAERNRRRLLEAAEELLATKGLAVGLDEIARHAGVGVATAYRRFPDKERLIDALFEERLDRIVALAERALEHDDPWEGFAGFVAAGVELHASNRFVKELMFTSGRGEVIVNRARARLWPLTAELIRRAQESGDLRPDVQVADMPVLLFMVSGVADLGGPHVAELLPRYLAIVLDGLRTPRARPLPAPALTPDAFAETIAAGGR